MKQSILIRARNSVHWMKRRATQQVATAVSGLGLLVMAFASSVAQAGVEYSLRADEMQSGVYVLYVRSDVTVSRPQSMVGSAQVTIVLPNGAVPTPVDSSAAYKVTDNTMVEGHWSGQDVSQDVGAPDIDDANADILQVNIAPTGPDISMIAGEEIEIFRFAITGDCQGELRLLENSEPFGSEKPNVRGLASANAWITLLDEQYVGNYRTGEAACP